jgi:hypothetical protein
LTSRQVAGWSSTMLYALPGCPFSDPADGRANFVSRLIVGRVSGGIGGVGTPGQVDQDQDVAERIADYAGSAHRDVERCRDEDAAVLDQASDSVLDIVDEPVGLIALPGRQHQLAVPIGELQSGLADRVVAPLQSVAQGLAIEAQTRVEVRHRHADRVDPSKDPTTAHP